MRGAFDDAPLQESFYVVCLNRKHRPICRNRVTLGTATSTLAHPREVFRIAILASAAAIVCVHNHPSGDPSPSFCRLGGDTTIKRSVQDLLGIELLDHIVIGPPGTMTPRGGATIASATPDLSDESGQLAEAGNPAWLDGTARVWARLAPCNP